MVLNIMGRIIISVLKDDAAAGKLLNKVDVAFSSWWPSVPGKGSSTRSC